MSEDKLIEKARAFAKSGELQRAKDILEALDSERAKSLLNKVNQAISAKKQEALSNRGNAPKEKAKAKNKSSNTALKVLIVFGLAFGIVTAAYFTWQNFMTTTREVYGVLALELSCGLLYPDSDAECEAEAERIFRDFPTETQECTEESQTGTQQYVMRSCLERYGIAFEIDE